MRAIDEQAVGRSERRKNLEAKNRSGRFDEVSAYGTFRCAETGSEP
jgi:hypothetical protein